MPTSPPRTLAEQLRGWSDDQLVVLLDARPDLAQPTPRDTAQLASRAGTRASVLRAVDELTAAELAVLDAVVLLGPEATLARVRDLVHAEASCVDAALGLLRARALVWGTDDRLRAASVVSEVLGSSVSGLGPSAAQLLPSYGPDRLTRLARDIGLTPTGERQTDVSALARHLSDTSVVTRLVADAGERAAALLEELLRSGGTGSVTQANRDIGVAEASTPLEAALARGLVVAVDARHVTLPREVAIALRGGHTTGSPVDRVPALATSTRDQSLVDRAAAGAAYEVVRYVEMLLDHWSTEPPGVLRSGGLGVRELRATARMLQIEEPRAALIVEVVSAAGLVAEGMTTSTEAAWLPTDAYDVWQAGEPAERWVSLALAWLGSTRLAPTPGVPEAPNTLADGLDRSWLVSTRRAALTELATLPAGEVLAAGTGVPSLVERLRWLRPRRPAARAAAVAATVTEAESLGIAALGGLATAGRALLTDDPRHQVPALLEVLLPAPVDHILIQADLTAVAPGPLEHELAHRIAAVADIESRGGATVYRFTESSVRRAFDAGWSAAEVHEFIGDASRTPIPQALGYLIDDVSRKFGTLRVGQAESFVRSDDEAGLAALVHDPRAKTLRLRRIAPTVVVSDMPVDTLMPRLRDLGLAPVVEAPDGTVRLARRDVLRARNPRRRGTEPGPRDQARRTAQFVATVAALRSGDRAAENRPSQGEARLTPTAVVTTLREAAESGASTWIEYVDNGGRTVELVVVPRRVEAGTLSAYDERSDETRRFALHRVRAVRTLET